MSHTCSRDPYGARGGSYHLASDFHIFTSSNLLSLLWLLISQGHCLKEIPYIEIHLRFCFLENPAKDIIFEMLISSSLGQQEPFQIFYLQKCQNFLYQNTQAIIFEQDFYGTLVAQ